MFGTATRPGATRALLLGSGLFVFRFVKNGGRWVSFAANRHLYNRQGQLSVGRVLDRDGDVLSWTEEDGTRRWYDNSTVRKATLHAVGDAQGNIGTGALVAFADQLSGYNLLTGAYSPLGAGNDLYLTLDARYNYIAYEALAGRKGAVGVYNYETGEVLCMVSTPAFDPLYPPSAEEMEGNDAYDGVYLNRFLSGTFPPGSVYKTVVLSAAIERIPDLFDRTWTCTGSTQGGGPSPAPTPTRSRTSPPPWPTRATGCSPCWPTSWGRTCWRSTPSGQGSPPPIGSAA